MSSFCYGNLFPAIQLKMYFLGTYYVQCSARRLQEGVKTQPQLGRNGNHRGDKTGSN